MQHMASYGVTSMLTLEVAQSNESNAVTSGLRLSYMSDNIITLRLSCDEPAPERNLRILKARATNHDLAEHPFVIGGNGITLAG